jgi:anti-anti-sigma factor
MAWKCGRIELHERDDAAVIELVGEIDISNVTELRDMFARAAASHKHKIVVSFSKTRFFDARTVRALDELRHEVQPGTEIELRDGHEQGVCDLIRRLGLDRAFQLRAC